MVSRSNWWRRTFTRFWKTPRRPYRRRPERSLDLLVESLEDRTLLSTVTFSGRSLTWNGFMASSGANAAQMSVDNTQMLILQDTSGENITLVNAPADWSGSGTPTAMGLLSDVDAITIDGTAPANPADSFTLASGGGNVNLTGSFAVTGFDTIAVDTSLAATAGNSVSLTANATATSTLGFGAAGITVSADTQSYRAGSGTGTTAAADLVTNAPIFTNAAVSSSPMMFTYRQDASIAAANFPDQNTQFVGILPFDYTVQSDGGSITTPSALLTGNNLTLLANGALTIDGSLDLINLMAESGLSGTGNLTFGAGVTISSNIQSYQAGNGGGNTAVADLVTNTPTFLNDIGTAPPVTFTLNQDASVTAATVPDAPQFGGALPDTYTIDSADGSITTPATTTVSSSTFLILNAAIGITIDWNLTVNTLFATAGGDIAVAAPITTSANVILRAGGMITESGTGAISADQLTTTSATGTTLGGANAFMIFLATNTTSGDITLTDAVATLTILGITPPATANVMVTNTGGNIAVNGTIGASVSVGLTAGGAITESASGLIRTNQLTTSSATGTALSTINAVGAFQASNSTSGVISLFDVSSPLIISGITQSGPGDVTVTNTGTNLDVTSKITMTGGTLRLTSSGTVTINAPIDPAAVVIISASADAVINSPVTATNRIAVFAGTDPTTHTGNVIVNATLTQSTAGQTGIELYTGTTAGSITLAAAVSAQDTGWLTATNNATESAGGTISAAKLLLLGTGTGTFTLNQANMVGSGGTAGILAGQLTGDLTFTNNFAITVGTLPKPQGGMNVLGITSTTGNITLTLNGGASLLTIGTASNGESITASGAAAIVDLNVGGATENTNAIITAANLRLQGTGTFNLGQNNAVGTLAGNFTGALTFTDSTALTVGTVLTTAGLNSNGNNVTLTVNNGTSLLTIGTASNGQSITATGATVDLNAGGVTENTNAIITAANLRLRGTGTFNLNQNNAVGTLAGNFTGALTFNDTTALVIGTVLTTAGLNSNGNNITLTVNNGTSLLTIGTASNGESITATGATVDINSGGATENTNAIITAANLRLRGTGTFNLGQTNVIATLAGSFTGALVFNDNNPNPTALTVGTVLGTIGLTSTNNNITLCNTGDILLNQPVNAGTNAGAVTVRLKSGGAVTQGTGAGAMGVITADNLGIDAVGNVTIDKFANSVTTFAARGAAVSVRFAGPFSLGTVTAAACFTSTITGIMPPAGPGQDITICQDTGTLTITMPINAGAGTVRLVASNGGVTQSAGATITAAALGVRATSNASVVTGGDIALDLANNSVGTFVALNMDTNRWAIRFLNTNAAGTTVGTVTAAAPCFIQTAGVANTNGDVTLNSGNGTTLLTIGSGSNEGITATGGTVDLFTGGATEAAGSIITATNLRLRSAGPGPFTFTLGQTNAVSSTLAGNFFGSLTFTNNAGITVAAITLNAVTTPDLTSNGGNITLTLNGGAGLLTINTPTGMGIQAGAATVDLNVGGATEANATSIITAGGLRLQGTGTFSLNQPNVVAILAGNFNGVLNFTNATALIVGTVLSTSGLTSNGHNITLTLNGGASPLTINTPIVAVGAVVDINAGGATEATATSTITAAALRLRGTGTFNLGQTNNAVATIAGNVTGSLSFFDAIPLTVGTVLGTAGLTSTTGNITLMVAIATSLLSIGTGGSEGITAMFGTVALFAGGAIEAPGSTIAAANLLIVGAGTFNLNQNNSVATFAGFTTGSIVYVNNRPLTVGTVAAPAGGGSVSGLTSLTGDIILVVGGGTALLSIGTGMPAQTIRAPNLYIDAGGVVEGTDMPIDVINLNLHSAAGGPFNFTMTGNNLVRVLSGDFFGPLTFNDVVTSGVLVANIFGTAGLTSHGSAITLTVTGPLVVNETINAGATGNVSITASGLVIFNNDAPITANTAALHGMPGTATLVVNYSGLVDTTWTITAANAGTIANSRFIITSSPQAITFAGFMNLVGGAGADTFVFHDGATLSGFIDGGRATISGKVDTIDWSQYTTPRIVSVLGPSTHGVFGTESSLGDGFLDIDRLVGPNAGASTLIGPNHNNTWSITGPNAGTLTTDYGGGVMSVVSFAGFPNLKGGILIDTFVFQNGGQITGVIDGGGVPAPFMDSLDWSQVTTNRLVGIAGFGSLHGYAGSATSVGLFTNIDQVIGSATAMQNSLFGENQDRAWTVGVNGSTTNVQGTYAPPGGGPVLTFANFQILVGGSGADTFNVNATPAGKIITLFGGAGNDTFNLGGTLNSLDQILGPVILDGGRPASTTPQSQSATVSCPPAPNQAANARPPVSQTAAWVSGGDVLNINDTAGATGALGLTYNLGNRGQFTRAASGPSPIVAYFASVEEVHLLTSPNPTQTINISDTAVNDTANPGTPIHTQTTVQVSGTGSSTVNLFTTGDSSALLLTATSGSPAVGIFTTGMNSYTRVTTANGSVYQAGSGAASIVDINASGGSNNQVNFLNNTPGTGPNSATRVSVAGVAVILQSADHTSGLSITAASASQINVGLFNKQTPYPPHPFAAALVNVSGAGVLNFVNAQNQPSTINTGTFRFVSGGAGNPNLITSPDGTAVYLCSTGVSLPQQTFVVAAFLLPNQLDASGRPVARIVASSQLAGNFQVQNFSLPPVVANPNFANPFGFGPPSVTVADVNGDGVPDLIVGAGPGFAPQVTVFNGTTLFNTLGQAPAKLAEFFAYDSRFVGGVYVAVGNIAPELGKNAIITGTGRGGFAIVQAFVLNAPFNPNVFPGGGAGLIRSFVAYPNTTNGVRVAAGNFNGGNHDDIVTAPGPGDAPNVRIFSGTNPSILLRSFFAYDPAFRGGVDIAVGRFHSGGDTFDDLVTAPASAGTTQINVFSGPTGALQAVFSAFPGTFNGVGGIAVDVSTGTARILVGSALGQPAQVVAFDGAGNPVALIFFDAAGNPINDPFFDAFGSPTNNPALANHEGVSVGAKSR